MKRVFFGVFITSAEVAAVDVDRNEGFGRVDDNRTAPLERNDPLVDPRDLLLEFEAVEEGFSTIVQLDSVGVLGHHQFHELFGSLEGLWRVDQDRIDIFGKRITNGPDHDIGLFIDIAGSRLILDPFGEHFPEPQQISHIAIEFFAVAFLCGGPDDEPNPFGDVDFMHGGLEFFSLDFVFDLAADSDSSERGHEDKVATGDTDIGREGWTLGADSLFDDLDDDFVAAFEDLLDGWFEPRSAASKFPATWIWPPGALGWVLVPTSFFIIDPEILAA